MNRLHAALVKIHLLLLSNRVEEKPKVTIEAGHAVLIGLIE